MLPIHGFKARRELRSRRRAADADLIDAPAPPPRLAWRAQELTCDANRLDLARSVMDLVRHADVGLLPGASPANRVAVRSARSELLSLASRLAALERPVVPRGVLLAEQLVIDARSPFYDRDRDGEARQLTLIALQALDRQQ